MRTMEFSGRTVDEAIFHGLQEMGVTIDQVDIVTVQNERKGIFGIGAQQAIVRLTEREIPVVPDFDAVNEERREQKQAARKNREENRDNREDRRDNNRDRKPRDNRDNRRDNRKSRDNRQDKAPSDTAKDETPYTLEKAQELESARFLQELLEKMQVNGTVRAYENEEGIRLTIDSDTDGLLIGRRGETLDAIQYIVSLYENRNRQDDYRRVSVDTEGYRARREDTLRKLARRNALKVYKSGRAMAMEPMNPYERRIIHGALQNFRGVTTHSEGEEPNRRVVIEPSDD